MSEVTYETVVYSFREDYPVKKFKSSDKPTITTIDGANGTPVAIEVATDYVELCLPLGTMVEVNKTSYK